MPRQQLGVSTWDQGWGSASPPLASLLNQCVVFGARDPNSGITSGRVGSSLHRPLLCCWSQGVWAWAEVYVPFVLSCSPPPGPAVGQYASPTAKRCCQDGVTRLPMKRSCEQRAARVQQPDCREPFLSCCQFAESLRKTNRTRGQVGLQRGKGLGGARAQVAVLGKAERPPPHSRPLWSPSPGDPAGGGPD